MSALSWPPSILKRAGWGRGWCPASFLHLSVWGCLLGYLRWVRWGEQASLLEVIQGVVLAIGLEVTGQGLLLLAELGRHLLIHIREEQVGIGLQLPLRLLKGLHHLGDTGQWTGSQPPAQGPASYL